MKPTTFDTEKAKQVEQAVCREFGTTISDIVSYRDSLAKKVVVFVLDKLYGYDKRILGHKYQMTYLYVPTVVYEIELNIKIVPGFENKINAIIKSIENEVEKMGTMGRRYFDS